MGVVDANHTSPIIGQGHLCPQNYAAHIGQLPRFHKPHQRFVTLGAHHFKPAVVPGDVLNARIQFPGGHGDHIPGFNPEGEVAPIPSFIRLGNLGESDEKAERQQGLS